MSNITESYDRFIEAARKSDPRLATELEANRPNVVEVDKSSRDFIDKMAGKTRRKGRKAR